MKLFTGILFGSALSCGQFQPNDQCPDPVAPDTENVGCYKYSAEGFPGGDTRTFYLITPTDCIEFCRGFTSKFYKYAGIANGGTCICATANDPNNAVPANTYCYDVCLGDKSQYCGGPDVDKIQYMTVYAIPTGQ